MTQPGLTHSLNWAARLSCTLWSSGVVIDELNRLNFSFWFALSNHLAVSSPSAHPLLLPQYKAVNGSLTTVTVHWKEILSWLCYNPWCLALLKCNVTEAVHCFCTSATTYYLCSDSFQILMPSESWVDSPILSALDIIHKPCFPCRP